MALGRTGREASPRLALNVTIGYISTFFLRNGEPSKGFEQGLWNAMSWKRHLSKYKETLESGHQKREEKENLVVLPPIVIWIYYKPQHSIIHPLIRPSTPDIFTKYNGLNTALELSFHFVCMLLHIQILPLGGAAKQKAAWGQRESPFVVRQPRAAVEFPSQPPSDSVSSPRRCSS